MLGYVQCGHISDDVQIEQRGKKKLAGLSSSNYSREYDKDPVLLGIAGPHDEKATVTLTVDLAGNCELEENRIIKFSLGTTVWICRSHRGTNQTGRFAKGTETINHNGRYVHSDKKKGKLRASERTFGLHWVFVVSRLYYSDAAATSSAVIHNL